MAIVWFLIIVAIVGIVYFGWAKLVLGGVLIFAVAFFGSACIAGMMDWFKKKPEKPKEEPKKIDVSNLVVTVKKPEAEDELTRLRKMAGLE